MNLLSLILAVIAAVIFALSYRPSVPQATVPLGLFVLTLAWLAQLLIVTTDPITF